MISAISNGFLFGLSLIVAIGAQNMLVLRQGLLLQHVFIVCFICSISDAILIQLGVFIMGKAIIFHPLLSLCLKLFGAAFLMFYGFLRFRAAWQGGESLQMAKEKIISRKQMVLTVLAFTWLNPHVYLDTVLLLGTVASKFVPYQNYFSFGAIGASFVFFFCLGYGARFLRPVLCSPRAWQILETFIGILMFYFAGKLLLAN